MNGLWPSRRRWLSFVCAALCSWQPLRAHAQQAPYDVPSPSPESLLTFVFLDALALERQAEPSPMCAQLYHDLDAALDRLIQSKDWQHVAWSFSRSGLYDTLDDLLARGCNENLAQTVDGESLECRSLRNQGRRQLFLVEHTPSVQAVLASDAMRQWSLHLMVGRATGCLVPHVEPHGL